MGDRATIEVKDGERSVYLYTHWDGHDAEHSLRRALAKRWRWHDAAYLTRIIFCEMIKNAHNEETGYGISSWETDSEYGPLVVDVERQCVNETSFADFVAFERA